VMPEVLERNDGVRDVDRDRVLERWLTHNRLGSEYF
jgi:hypothetical protein